MVSDSDFAGTITLARFIDGIASNRYICTNIINTANGERLEGAIEIEVMEAAAIAGL